MIAAQTVRADRAAFGTPLRSSFEIRPLASAESTDWDQGAARWSPDCFFLRTSWLGLLAEILGWRVSLVGCYERDKLVAGAAGRLRGENCASTLFDRLLLAPYNGCWLSDGPASLAHRVEHRRHVTLSALARGIRGQFAKAVVDLHPANTDVRAFTWDGWDATVRYSYLNDLTRFGDSTLAPSVRRRVRRASAAGVEFDPAVSSDEFISLWSVSLARQNLRPPIPPESLRKLLGTLPARAIPHAIYGTRLSDGRLVAANVILYDRAVAYYWLAGFDSEEPNRGAANQFCHVLTLREAARRAERFDWVGANTPSIAEYKRSYGPALVPYYRVTCRGVGLHAPRSSVSTSFVSWIRSCPLVQGVLGRSGPGLSQDAASGYQGEPARLTQGGNHAYGDLDT